MSKTWDPVKKIWVHDNEESSTVSKMESAMIAKKTNKKEPQTKEIVEHLAPPQTRWENDLQDVEAKVPVAAEVPVRERVQVKPIPEPITAERSGEDIVIQYKYNEQQLIQEIQDYIGSTYSGPYVDAEKKQVLDLILGTPHEIGFLVGNVLKYVYRYGKKGTVKDQRKDILKMIHYGTLLLHAHDESNK